MKNCQHRPALISIERSINHAGRSGMCCKYCGAPLKCINSRRIYPAFLPLILVLFALLLTDVEFALGNLIHANDPVGAGTAMLLIVALAMSAGIAALIWPSLKFVDIRMLPKDPLDKLYQKEPDPEVYNKYEL